MLNVKTIIISILCFTSILLSQNVWSIKAGLAYSEMQEANIPHSTGLSLGIVRHFQVFGNLFSDIEFTVTNKKANYGKIRVRIVNGPIYGLIYSAQLNLNLFMVEIPVMLKYKINLTKNCSISPNVGMSISHFVGINSEKKQLKYLGEIGDVDYDLYYIAEGASSNLVRSRIIGFTFYYSHFFWVEVRYCQDLRTVGDVGGYHIEDKFHSFFLLFGLPI